MGLAFFPCPFSTSSWWNVNYSQLWSLCFLALSDYISSLTTWLELSPAVKTLHSHLHCTNYRAAQCNSSEQATLFPSNRNYFHLEQYILLHNGLLLTRHSDFVHLMPQGNFECTKPRLLSHGILIKLVLEAEFSRAKGGLGCAVSHLSWSLRRFQWQDFVWRCSTGTCRAGLCTPCT